MRCGGFLKVQAAADLIRFKQNYWYIAGLSALMSIIFAFVIFYNPFATTAALWIFAGVTLIISAVVDIIAIIADIFVDRKKEKDRDKNEI